MSKIEIIMKKTLFLLFINLTVFAQENPSRLWFTPYLGIGTKLPETQMQLSGNESLTHIFAFSEIGTFINQSGEEFTSYKLNNRLGFSLGYKMFDKIEIKAGANRTNLVSQYNLPFNYTFFGQNVVSITSTYSFYNLTGGFTYYLPKRWITVEAHYSPDFQFSATQSSAIASTNNGDARNTVGTGYVTSGRDFVKTLPSFYVGIGQKSIFDLNVELGVNFALKPYETASIDFYNNRIRTSATEINSSINAVYLTVRQPIGLGFKKRVRTPKPPKVEKPKVEKPKKEKLAKKEKEAYEFKDKIIFSGDDVVLNNIKFDQSKAELLTDGMKELDDVYELLKKYPDAKVALTGHTSQEGNRRDNIDLSEDRAKACKNYLVKKGIKSSRIQAYGVGPDKPISTNNSELNRRVEIKVF
jgi:outer membrane protein OmpA-like peptidoglycan-associated protein